MAYTMFTELYMSRLCSKAEAEIASFMYSKQIECATPKLIKQGLGGSEKTALKVLEKLYLRGWVDKTADGYSLNANFLMELLKRAGAAPAAEFDRPTVNSLVGAIAVNKTGDHPENAPGTAVTPRVPQSEMSKAVPAQPVERNEKPKRQRQQKVPYPESAAEVQAFMDQFIQEQQAKENHNYDNVNTAYAAERCFNFYASKGWATKSGPIKDWRYSARNSLLWEDNINSKDTVKAPEPKKDDSMYEPDSSIYSDPRYVVYRADGQVDRGGTYVRWVREQQAKMAHDQAVQAEGEWINAEPEVMQSEAVLKTPF